MTTPTSTSLPQTLILIAGLPGCGKSTLAKKHEAHPVAASWTGQVAAQSERYEPWLPGQALFVDNLAPLEQHLPRILHYITDPEVTLSGWD